MVVPRVIGHFQFELVSAMALFWFDVVVLAIMSSRDLTSSVVAELVYLLVEFFLLYSLIPVLW